MQWFINNLPAISAIVVPSLAMLTALLNFMRDRYAGDRLARKLEVYSKVYRVLPKSSNAKLSKEKLIESEAKNLCRLATRMIDGVNLGAFLVVIPILGVICYFLALWALSTNVTLWSVLLWIIFAVVTFLAVGLGVTALSQLYKYPDEGKS